MARQAFDLVAASTTTAHSSPGPQRRLTVYDSRAGQMLAQSTPRRRLQGFLRLFHLTCPQRQDCGTYAQSRNSLNAFQPIVTVLLLSVFRCAIAEVLQSEGLEVVNIILSYGRLTQESTAFRLALVKGRGCWPRDGKLLRGCGWSHEARSSGRPCWPTARFPAGTCAKMKTRTRPS